MLKFWKIACIVLGSFLLLIAMLVALRMYISAEGETAYMIGYMIGSLFTFLPSLWLFYMAYRLHKKIASKRMNREVDSFLNHE